MLDAWRTRRALRRRADAAAASARTAARATRRHVRTALRESIQWAAGGPGLVTLFGLGLASGYAGARDDGTADAAPPRRDTHPPGGADRRCGADPHGASAPQAADRPHARQATDNTGGGRKSLTRDLFVNTASRLAVAMIAARLAAGHGADNGAD